MFSKDMEISLSILWLVTLARGSFSDLFSLPMWLGEGEGEPQLCFIAVLEIKERRKPQTHQAHADPYVSSKETRGSSETIFCCNLV